jgi:hypothetical protein
MTSLAAIDAILARVAALESEAQEALAGHEDALARVLTLQGSFARLAGLSLDQDQLFREALRAVEHRLFRAAHVLAWAGFIDYFHNFLIPGHAAALTAARPAWNLHSVDDLRDYADFQVIEAAKAAGIYKNTMMKALHGLLNRRNECAHPSDHAPDLNQTLGYISELFSRVEQLQRL